MGGFIILAGIILIFTGIGLPLGVILIIVGICVANNEAEAEQIRQDKQEQIKQDQRDIIEPLDYYDVGH